MNDINQKKNLAQVLLPATIITMPSFDSLIASTTAYAGGMFWTLIPIALGICGIIVGVLLARLFVIKGVMKGVKRLTGRR